MRKTIWVLAAVPALLFGQLPANTVTVTASRPVNSQPDQAAFNIEVDSDLNQGLEDIVRALAGTGVTEKNLTQICRLNRPDGLEWTFALTVPFTKMKETIASLTSLETTISSRNKSLSLDFSVGSSGSTAPSGCDLGGLIADARTQAQKRANAAGYSLGQIVAITSDPSCSIDVSFVLGNLGQSSQHSIEILASRSAAQADQVSFSINVTSGLNSNLDDINGVLAKAGIRNAAFSYFFTATVLDFRGKSQTGLSWSFSFTAPLAKIKETLAQLLAAEASVPKENAGFTFSFNIGSLQSLPQPCSESDLIADARVQAQQVAAAAGVSLGPIIGVSNGSSNTNALLGGFVGYVIPNTLVLGRFSPTPAAAPSCSLAVQFQLY